MHAVTIDKVVIPRRGRETFMSSLGYLDGRVDLCKNQNLVEEIVGSASKETGGIKVEFGRRALMDLCIMASKLAYENSKFIRKIVNDRWKKHFVSFFNGWNDYLEKWATQVFIFCDKAKDANLIMISFRGTEPFKADDWCTDLDISWYEISNSVKLHLGFLKALGLGNRIRRNFKSSLRISTKVDNTKSHYMNQECDRTFDAEEVIKWSAYCKVRCKLINLLEKHRNAKFVGTGHGLDGALAIMFPTLLVLNINNEKDNEYIMSRLLGAYTFGQPRIGIQDLVEFMEPHLNNPAAPKYFRVVYCNVRVPRVPFDDKIFLFKHFGVCLHYDRGYFENELDEVPSCNYFGLFSLISKYINAVWELIRSLTIGYKSGKEYKEGWLRILFRIIGVAFPGISAHCSTDYVNSVRLGKKRKL